MQLWQYCLLVTAGLLYMFRTFSASIIRSINIDIQEFVCIDTTIVEHEVYGHTGNYWRHRNSDTKV